MIGIQIIRIFLFASVIWGLSTQESPVKINLDQSSEKPFTHWSHPLGCDVLGRDVLALYSYGVLSTIILAIPARILTLVFSLFVSLISYSLGKTFQYFLDQISNVFLSVPSLLIALMTVAFLGSGFWTVPLAVLFSDWAYSYESIQSRIREIRESPYVSLSLSMGAGGIFVFWNHILPGLFSIVSYLFLTGVPNVIMSLALFNFLGVDWSSDMFGPGLGEQIAFSFDYFSRNPYAVYTPILGIVLLVMGLGKR